MSVCVGGVQEAGPEKWNWFNQVGERKGSGNPCRSGWKLGNLKQLGTEFPAEPWDAGPAPAVAVALHYSEDIPSVRLGWLLLVAAGKVL